MKSRKFNKKILAMALGAFLAGSSLTSAFAAGQLENITVRNGIQLNLNGENVTPVDASGKEMPVFLYDSTTYVPVKFLSEKYGKNVEWDGDNAAVYITDPIEVNEGENDFIPDQEQLESRISLVDFFKTAGSTESNNVRVVENVETADGGFVSEGLELDLDSSNLKLLLNDQYSGFSFNASLKKGGATVVQVLKINKYGKYGLINSVRDYISGSTSSDYATNVEGTYSLEMLFQRDGNIRISDVHLILYDAYLYK